MYIDRLIITLYRCSKFYFSTHSRQYGATPQRPLGPRACVAAKPFPQQERQRANGMQPSLSLCAVSRRCVRCWRWSAVTGALALCIVLAECV